MRQLCTLWCVKNNLLVVLHRRNSQVVHRKRNSYYDWAEQTRLVYHLPDEAVPDPRKMVLKKGHRMQSFHAVKSRAYRYKIVACYSVPPLMREAPEIKGKNNSMNITSVIQISLQYMKLSNAISSENVLT